MTLIRCDNCDKELHEHDLVLRVEAQGLIRTYATPDEAHLCSYLCMKQYAEDRELSA